MKIDYMGPYGSVHTRRVMAAGTTSETAIRRPGRGRWPIVLAVVVIIAAVAGVVGYEIFSATPTITIQGAGATFPAPLIQSWTTTYHGLYPNVTINYNSVGSGAGYQFIHNKTADFGASDAPLTDNQLSSSPGLTLFPETLGGVAITYNVPGFSSPPTLNFTGDIIVEMYNGTITQWNDQAIKNINPGVASLLPSTAITAVHRSDGSGTTYAFTDYLSAVNPWWSASVHYNTTVGWPGSSTFLPNVLTAAGKGNAGVASTVKNTPGAIGYVDVIYAQQQNLGVGAVRNSSNNYVTPTLQSILYAAENATVIASPTDLRQHIVNAGGSQSYPIATYTYILVYKDMSTNTHTTKTMALALAKFLWWAVHDGQSYAPGLLYVKLPANIVSADETLLRALNYQGQQLITS